MDKKKYRVYKKSSESWFYKKFIKDTVNDNFITPIEVLDRDSNQTLIKKIKKMKLEKYDT